VAADEGSLKGVHVIHLTGHNGFNFKPPEVAAIKNAIQGGAFLLIDPASGGRNSWIRRKPWSSNSG